MIMMMTIINNIDNNNNNHKINNSSNNSNELEKMMMMIMIIIIIIIIIIIYAQSHFTFLVILQRNPLVLDRTQSQTKTRTRTANTVKRRKSYLSLLKTSLPLLPLTFSFRPPTSDVDPFRNFHDS